MGLITINRVINIHSVIPVSRINGPGSRMVVFFQGCKRNCQGCFNPDTHSFDTENFFTPEEIFENHHTGKIEGLTVSGGEPFLQVEGLCNLLKLAHETYRLSTVVYTGFSYSELKADPAAEACLELIDVLIDGMYDESDKETSLLARGSVNQGFHFLSNRYKKEDFYMQGKVEVIIGTEGRIIATGFGKVDLKKLTYDKLGTVS